MNTGADDWSPDQPDRRQHNMLGEHQHPTTRERGPQGERGERGRTTTPYLERNKVIALFAFIVLAFVLLAYRTEVNDKDNDTNTERIMRNQHMSCQDSLSILLKFNEQQRANTEIEKANPFINDEVREQRLKAYAAAILPLPDCKAIQ